MGPALKAARAIAPATYELRIKSRVPLRLDGKEAATVVSWRAQFTERGLSSLTLMRSAAKSSPHAGPHADGVKKLIDALEKRQAGKDASLPWSFFDLTNAPDFHTRVWKAMREIPFGKTLSYGEVAENAGSPMAFRACGQACGANRILLFIPCHRVLGASGIGGFGCGLDIKRWLLNLEGIHL
jgi:methylated-DNA-[protein]-cysteine S-methyltransferase